MTIQHYLISRRKLLKFGCLLFPLSASASVAVPNLSDFRTQISASPNQQLIHQLLSVLPKSESSAALGKMYVEQAPDQRDIGQLLNDVLSNQTLALPLSKAESPTAAIAVINECIKSDFAQRNTTRINGWVLSSTEVKLCALAYLKSLV